MHGSAIARLRETRSSQLTVAASPLALTPALAQALARARSSAPGLAVSVQVLGRDAVVRAVMAGDADLGLVDGTAAPTDPLPLPDPGPLATIGVAEEPLAVLLPADHPLAHRHALRLPDLADAHWLDAPDTAVPLAQLRAAARTDGFCPQVTYHGTDLRGVGTPRPRARRELGRAAEPAVRHPPGRHTAARPGNTGHRCRGCRPVQPLPYSFQMAALRRLPPGVFGVLTSLEPAVGTVIGLSFLGQHLAPQQWTGVVAVALASVGAVGRGTREV